MMSMVPMALLLVEDTGKELQWGTVGKGKKEAEAAAEGKKEE